MGNSHHPCTLTNMELSKILLLVSSIAAAPQSSFPRIPVARFVDKVRGENYVTDNRVKVAVSSKSPSTAAALAYVNSVVKEGLCGEAAEAYVKSILNGGSKKAAVAEATRAYITAFNSGERYEAGGACEAADRAWKVARVSGGKDHVLEATLAFIRQFQQTLLVPLLHSHLHKQSVKSQAVQLMLLCLLILMKPSGRETECLTLCVGQPPWHTGMLSLRRRMSLLLVRLQLWRILMHLNLTQILMRMVLVAKLQKHTWLNLKSDIHQ